LFRCPDFGVLDVREATEFQEGHVPGAINIAHTGLLDRQKRARQRGPLPRASVASALLERDALTRNILTTLLIAGSKRKQFENVGQKGVFGRSCN